MEGREVGVDRGAGEAGDRGAGKGGAAHRATGLEGRSEDRGEAVAKVGVVLEGSRPEGGVNGFGPSVSGVEKGSASLGGNVLDPIFGAAVLMVGIDAAEGERLVGGGDRGAESCCIEEAVVGMVVADGDAVLDRAKAFESLLGSNSCLLI